MKTTSLIPLHTKAIKTLEAIEKAQRRIAFTQKDIAEMNANKVPWLDYVLKSREERIETDKLIIDRLAAIYSNLMVRINKLNAPNPLNESKNGTI